MQAIEKFHHRATQQFIDANELYPPGCRDNTLLEILRVYSTGRPLIQPHDIAV